MRAQSFLQRAHAHNFSLIGEAIRELSWQEVAFLPTLIAIFVIVCFDLLLISKVLVIMMIGYDYRDPPA